MVLDAQRARSACCALLSALCEQIDAVRTLRNAG